MCLHVRSSERCARDGAPNDGAAVPAAAAATQAEAAASLSAAALAAAFGVAAAAAAGNALGSTSSIALASEAAALCRPPEKDGRANLPGVGVSRIRSPLSVSNIDAARRRGVTAGSNALVVVGGGAAGIADDDASADVASAAVSTSEENDERGLASERRLISDTAGLFTERRRIKCVRWRSASVVQGSLVPPPAAGGAWTSIF